MKLNEIRWGAALGGALVAEVVLIASAVAWVAIYSHLLHPGESLAFYQRYATSASPWVSVVMGVPVFYLISRWIGSRSPAKAFSTAMALFGFYLLLDLPLTLLGGDNPTITPLFIAANYGVKFLACYFGGRSAAATEVASLA